MNKNLLKNLIKFSVYFTLIGVTIGFQTNRSNNNKNNNNNFNKISNNNDYCSKEFCTKGHHIACHNKGTFSSKCPSDAQIITFKNNHKDLFVHLHNKHRSTVASGQLSGFKPATRMATMIWDDELAKMAELNVKKCTFEHDECFATKKFRNTGQCLSGRIYYNPNGFDLDESITKAVDAWFKEHKNIDMSYVEHFRVDSKFKHYGHFLQMVVDRNTHVGCAGVHFTNPKDQLKYPGYKRINIACNYASVYSRELPVYESGSSTSKCITGKNPKYPGLCSLKERINPNHNVDFDF